jgi:hypothetical protein
MAAGCRAAAYRNRMLIRHDFSPLRRHRLRLAAAVVLTACSNADAPPPVAPVAGDGANLRLQQVIFTQVVQNDARSIPLIAGAPAAAKVLITRSKESVNEVPVVLRLFRGGALVHTDTTRTGGVLSRAYSFAASSAQFLIPSAFVASDVTWQVEIDPGQTVPDSTRTDNRLPATGADSLRTINVPPFRVRLIPVVLARHGNLTGDVSVANAEVYLRATRQLFPIRELRVSIGAPITTLAYFGTPPDGGGDYAFWEPVLGDIEQARLASGSVDEHWYGIVPIPRGYGAIRWGGLAYLGFASGGSVFPSYTAAGADALSSNPAYASQTLAHELGHNFGRTHAPGCNAAPPVDPAFPNGSGVITSVGHDVWSWVNGGAIGAPTVGAETADIMSYCAPPRWISAYTYGAVLQWRSAAGVATRRVRGVEQTAVP